MNRMDKYADETPELKRRVDKYSGLYESNSSNDYDKFDVDSNVSVLKDNARSIDVDQIREMLDKKYRDNINGMKIKTLFLNRENDNFIQENQINILCNIINYLFV